MRNKDSKEEQGEKLRGEGNKEKKKKEEEKEEKKEEGTRFYPKKST